MSAVDAHAGPRQRMMRSLGIVAAGTVALAALGTNRRVPRPIAIGGFVGLLAGLAVTAARTVARLDAARAAAELETAASHNQLQKLIDNSKANIYMKRIDNGQYLLVNREWERLFGVTRDQVINMTDHGVFPDTLADQLRADITERKRAEDQVRQLNAELETRVRERTAELEASTRELDAFAYSVSHDLRAPLRSLHGFSEALLDDYGDVLDEEGRDNLNRLQHNVQRMSRMIDDLLNLSRATRVEITRERIDISAMARDIVGELAAADPHRDVDLRVADGLRGYGDPQLVRLALQNLLANAWKFTAHRHDPLIEVGRAWRDGADVFFVRDNGAGFDMRYAAKLFNAFQRLHPAAQFEGTGIGLAIVARVVRRHGGHVFAHAEVDQGATFSFNLSTATEAPA